MLDTILSWIYTILNWFRSPLRQIPTEVTERNMDTDGSTARQPQQQHEEQAPAAEGVATHDSEGLSRRVPGQHLAAATCDDDIRLDDPANPQPAVDPVLVLGGPGVQSGRPHSLTAMPLLPDAATAEKLDKPADPADLAARSQELNKEGDGGAEEHAAVAPPPSAVGGIDGDGDGALASDIIQANRGPVIVPEILADKLQKEQGGADKVKEEVGARDVGARRAVRAAREEHHYNESIQPRLEKEKTSTSEACAGLHSQTHRLNG